MALFCGVRAVIQILSAQLRLLLIIRIIINLPKDMGSSQVLNFANWITISLYYKREIFKLFYKANNNILPDCLSKSIFRERESSYSLLGQNVASIPRCNGRLLRDSLAFRGSALWNLINCNDKIDIF